MTNPPTPQVSKPCYLCDGDEMVTVYSETGEYDIDCPACSPEYQEKADRVEELEKENERMSIALGNILMGGENAIPDHARFRSWARNLAKEALTNPGEKGAEG